MLIKSVKSEKLTVIDVICLQTFLFSGNINRYHHRRSLKYEIHLLMFKRYLKKKKLKINFALHERVVRYFLLSHRN